MSLLSLLQYCFCFMFWFFDPEACEILAPQPGMEPTPPALKGKLSQPLDHQGISKLSHLKVVLCSAPFRWDTVQSDYCIFRI